MSMVKLIYCISAMGEIAMETDNRPLDDDLINDLIDAFDRGAGAILKEVAQPGKEWGISLERIEDDEGETIYDSTDED